MVAPGPTLDFQRHHAFIVGINAYRHASPLQTAVGDAQELARVLSAQQHFSVHPPLLDASGADLRTLLRQTLAATVGPQDRVLFYFAGHGISVDGDDGPAGYLLPADAELDEPDSFISMAELQRSLEALPCRHLLLILDCCFSGAFKWSSGYRAAGHFMPKKIYQERFDRFVADPAWQVITSAAHDQKALDVVRGIGRATGARGTAQHDAAHSPFAKALFDGLAGAADAKGDDEGDGVITATELYLYVRDQVEPRTLESGQRHRQTPGFFPLKKHDKGEFIFLHPRHRLNLPPMPNRSPYKGLASFDEDDQLLFYGRDRVIEELRAKVRAHPLLVVSGASGTGKSSVIKAGLLPLLRAEGLQILPVIRPGAHPMAELDGALQALGSTKAVLLIDQYEEVLTRCADPDERQRFDARLAELLAGDTRLHRLVITVRADFEPQLNRGALKDAWQQGRCTVPPFSLEELKEVIVMPTIQEVLVFEPPEMVEAIVGEVVQSPGALPLLSYALSELYEAYRSSKRLDRKLTEADYARLGGVMGALRTKADALYGQLSEPEQDTMRKLMLRMVSVEGDWASRRVPMEDLAYGPEAEAVVAGVIEQLVQARLIVKGEGFIEPAHDALIRAWPMLRDWVHTATPEMLILGGKLNASANEYLRSGDVDFLWNTNPNLPAVKAELARPGQWFNAKEADFIRKSVAQKDRKERTRLGIGAAIVVALVAAIWFLQGRSSARDGLTAQVSLAMASEARALIAGTRPLGVETTLQRLLAAHALTGYSPEVADALLASVVAFSRVTKLFPGYGSYSSVAFGRDGSVIAGAGGNASYDRFVAAWDADGKDIGYWSADDDVLSVAFDMTQTRIASGQADGNVVVRNAADRSDGVLLKGHAGGVRSVAFSHDGSQLVSGASDGIRVWDLKAHALVRAERVGGIASVAFSNGDDRIVAGGRDGLFLWERVGSNFGAPVKLHDGDVYSVAFHPAGDQVVVGGRDGLRLWNLKDRREVGPFEGQEGSVRSVAFSPDGLQIAAGADDGLTLWDAATRRRLAAAKLGSTAALAFNQDGSRLVIGGDGGIVLWDAKGDGAISLPLRGHVGEVRSVAFNPKADRLASGGDDGTIRRWQVDSGQPIGAPIRGHEGGVTSVAFNGDGSRLVSAGADGTVRQWDASGGTPIGPPLRGHQGPVNALAVLGSRIVSGGADGTVRQWDATNGQPIGAPLRAHADGIRRLAISPDGKRIVSCGLDGSVRVWNAESGVPIGTPNLALDGAINSVAFSREVVSSASLLFASAGEDGTVRVWDEDGLSARFRGHAGPVLQVAVTGEAMASGGLDGAIRLWTSLSFKSEAIGPSLKEHQGPVNSVALSDGLQTKIASAGRDGVVRLWPAHREAWARLLCSKLTSNLSSSQWEHGVSDQIDYREQCPGLPIER